MITVEKKGRERAIVVGLVRHGQTREMVDEYLDELELLADTAGADVLERVVQERPRMDSSFMLGKGKIEQVAESAKYLDADLIIFDDDLSPAQVKNIELMCNTKIVDRSGLILDIFAKHARTREARTQVELAQLKYLLPRLTRQWSHLSRQVGGIGVRGPGETQLEVDRRMIRKRISALEEELGQIVKQRDIRRKNRKDLFKAALVGYTNVGKSTILNLLTQADTLVKNQLFATLDSTIRSLELDDQEQILLIDTVGFIRKLPHHLVASFKSTLEEAAEADLLLHVIDVSLPEFRDQVKVVESVLSDLKINDRPILKVFNKIDLVEDPALLAQLRETDQPCVFISAARGIFIQGLKDELHRYSREHSRQLTFVLPNSAAKVIAKLHELAEKTSIEYKDDTAIINITATPLNASRIEKLVEGLVIEETVS